MVGKQKGKPASQKVAVPAKKSTARKPMSPAMRKKLSAMMNVSDVEEEGCGQQRTGESRDLKVLFFGILVILGVLSESIEARSQDSRHCRQLFKQGSALWKAGDFEHFIPVAREEMSDCSADWSLRVKTNRVADIGMALVRTKQYEDAIPRIGLGPAPSAVLEFPGSLT